MNARQHAQRPEPRAQTQLDLPIVSEPSCQQLCSSFFEGRTSADHLLRSELEPDPWPDALCWTRMHAESGQALGLIIERKEAERRAGNGVFFWGIGNPLGHRVAALAKRVERPQVLFSVMRSRPQRTDVAPTEVLLWTSFVDEHGSVRPLPDHVIVVSRGSGGGRAKLAHYALVCWSQQPLELRPRGELNLSAFRNLGSRNPRIGNSQVTAVLERQPAIETNLYKVDMAASLTHPYFVRLRGPMPLLAGERASLDEAAALSSGNPQKWIAFARSLRAAVHTRCADPVFPAWAV